MFRSPSGTICRTAAYLIYSSVSIRFFRSVFRNYRFWYTAHKSTGVICENAQDDLAFMFSLGIHHFTAAAFFSWGKRASDSAVWRHGYLIETGYEIGDLLAMVAGLTPYNCSVRKGLTFSFFCHHIPGIGLAFFFLTSDYRFNPHLMSIIVWLLLASSFSMFVTFFAQTLDLRKNIVLAAIAYNLNLVFFAYARLYIFPTESYHFIQDVRRTAAPGSNILVTSILAGAASLMAFNFGIMISATPPFLELLKKVFTGGDPYELEVQPPVEGRMPRRRSSILADALKRSSITGEFTTSYLNELKDRAKDD
mmetsp:Transcript_41670/g.97542  ORF Transcript_41670/g.97542 Transcript_41670/m.97542 type:complete len:308 (-) Transcript_41670:109-1032(-)